MLTRRSLLAVLTALTLALAACGGDDGGGNGNGGGDGGGGAAASDPKTIFSDKCGNCHTLAAAGTEGQVGPNLDDLKPDEATVKTAIEQGPSVMPENLVTGEQADAVAQYVAESAGR